MRNPFIKKAMTELVLERAKSLHKQKQQLITFAEGEGYLPYLQILQESLRIGTELVDEFSSSKILDEVSDELFHKEKVMREYDIVLEDILNTLDIVLDIKVLQQMIDRKYKETGNSRYNVDLMYKINSAKGKSKN